MKSKTNILYILILIFVGVVSIPLDMLPSQVMNDLTKKFTSSIFAQDKSFSFPWGIILLFISSVIGVAAINVFKSTLTAVIKENIVRIRSLELFNRIMRVSPAFFRKNDPPKIANRIINDTRRIEGFFLDLKLKLPLLLAGLIYFTYVMFAGLEISPSTPLIGAWFGGGGSVTLSCFDSDGKEKILNPVNGKYSDIPGAQLNIKAVPNEGYEFKKWLPLENVTVSNPTSTKTRVEFLGSDKVDASLLKKEDLKPEFLARLKKSNNKDKLSAELVKYLLDDDSNFVEDYISKFNEFIETNRKIPKVFKEESKDKLDSIDSQAKTLLEKVDAISNHELAYLNREILEYAYPFEIKKRLPIQSVIQAVFEKKRWTPFVVGDIKDEFLVKLKEAGDSEFIGKRIRDKVESPKSDSKINESYIRKLNKFLKSDRELHLIFKKQYKDKLDEMKDKKAKAILTNPDEPEGTDLAYLNREIVECVFSKEISKFQNQDEYDLTTSPSLVPSTPSRPDSQLCKRIFNVETTPRGFSQTGNWLLALLIVLFAPLRSFFVLFDKKIQKIYQSSATAGDNLLSVSTETLANVREIRNNFAFDFAKARLSAAFDKMRSVEIEIMKLTAIFTGIGPLIDGVITCSLLALGVYMCCIGEPKSFLGLVISPIEWKDYMGFTGMAMCVNGYIAGMFGMLFQWRMNKESIRRINEYKNEPEIFCDGNGSPVDGANSSIEFHKVSLSIDEVRILNEVSMLINSGKRVAFVGPSASGKSTAMNLIIQDLSLSSGDLKFGGKRIGDCDFMSLTRELGHVQQKPAIFNLSLRDNILLGIRRSSANSIPDKDGDLDVSRLPDCSGLAEINALLIDVTRKAELAGDITRKALDNPIPEKYLNSPLISKIRQIRAEIDKRLSSCSSAKFVIKYHTDTIFKESTILENIVYGRIKAGNKNDAFAPNPKEICARSLFEDMRNNSSLMTLILALGHKVLCQDRQIANSVLFTTPRLKQMLPSLRIEKSSKDGIEEKLGLNITSDAELLKLDDECKLSLFSISLELGAKRALTMIGDESEFQKLILAQRQTIQGKMPEAVKNIVARFDAQPDQAAGTLPLREFLLDGQVDSLINNAAETVEYLIEEVLQEMNLYDTLYLIGLEFPAGPDGNALTGGLCMKVAIARILMKKPNVLLLDEATAALDNKSQSRIVAMIEREFKGKTVVAIAHRLSMIRNFDNIVVFDKGRVVESGSYEELFARKGLFYNLLLLDQDDTIKLETRIPQTKRTQPPDEKLPVSAELCGAIAMSPVFKNLTSGQIRLIENSSNIVECEEGETIFMPGDEGDKYYMILEGIVDFFLSRSEDGKFDIVDSYGAGQSFGEIAVFGGGSRTLGAVARTKLRLCIINRDTLFDIIKMAPDIAINILKALSGIITKDRQNRFEKERS